MRCFHCGAVVNTTDYCGICGADLKLYHRLLQMSNAFYNDGLSKAKVRDLSGAIVSLRRSLKINKRNTDARNLLGLIYFETGEVVEALSQWIISHSYQSKKNLADEYIEMLQKNPARLEVIGTTIKKYNQSLLYCEQGSDDLAIIQLKKVLSNNGHFVKAHLLLALLYIKSENYNRARTEVKRVLAIDCNNTLALKYQRELEQRVGGQEQKEPEKTGDAIAYTSGNETIIQPVGVTDNSGILSILNVLIGLAIGVAVMWFLILPAQQKRSSDELNRAVAEYSDQVESKTAALATMQAEYDAMEQRVAEAEETAGEVAEQMDVYEKLLSAYQTYAGEDAVATLETLQGIDREGLNEPCGVLYDAMFADVGKEAVDSLYQSGFAAYQAGNYPDAITSLKKCYDLDNGRKDALYFLARAYHRSGDNENAKIYYQKVVDENPGTKQASDAAGFLRNLQ